MIEDGGRTPSSSLLGAMRSAMALIFFVTVGHCDSDGCAFDHVEIAEIITDRDDLVERG